GFVLDGEGRKMSKSLGNVMVPSNVQKQLGTDILRLWVSSVDYQADVRICQEILKQISESYRYIRNTFRLMLANFNDFDPEKHTLSEENLQKSDQYISVPITQLSYNMNINVVI